MRVKVAMSSNKRYSLIFIYPKKENKIDAYCLWTQESEDMPELELPPSSADLGIDTQLALEAITVYETLRQGCSCCENPLRIKSRFLDRNESYYCLFTQNHILRVKKY